VAGFRIGASSDFNGLALAHLRLLFPATPTLVAAIQRGGDWIIPHGDEEIAAGDPIYFSVARPDMPAVLELIGALRGDRGVSGGRRASLRRQVAFFRKERLQIRRDPSSIALALVMPVVLILLFGYGVSLDAENVPVAVVLDDAGPAGREQPAASTRSVTVHSTPSASRKAARSASASSGASSARWWTSKRSCSAASTRAGRRRVTQTTGRSLTPTRGTSAAVSRLHAAP